MSSASPLTTAYEGNDEFWSKYVKARPNIPQSYFQTIFDYHAEHNGHFDVAHDVGAGPGVHSARLLEQFDRVILSDAFENNVKIAQSQLQTSAERCTFMVSKVEDTVDKLPPASIDLIFAQAMLHYTQQDEALAAIAHQLRPGGTLAISMVGIPVLKDPDIWEIWTQMMQGLAADVIGKSGGPYGPTRFTMRSQHANLDSIPLSESTYLAGAIRIKMEDPLGQGRDFMRETLFGEELRDHYPLWSQIGESDIIRSVQNDEGWTFQTDYEGLRDMILTYPLNHDTQLQKDLWLKMKNVLGDRKTEGVWPYSLILATRKGESMDR